MKRVCTVSSRVKQTYPATTCNLLHGKCTCTIKEYTSSLINSTVIVY